MKLFNGSLTRNDDPPFMTMQSPCEEAVSLVIQQLDNAGMFVVRTFDLKVALLPQTDCPCPYHGTEQCDCQMIVLLVYADGGNPVSLVAHGSEGKTWISLVNNPQQHADSELFAIIQQNLLTPDFPGFDPSMVKSAL
jgi:hypothetical protein